MNTGQIDNDRTSCVEGVEVLKIAQELLALIDADKVIPVSC